VRASVPEPGHGEIQELLGVYALDAVDAETAAMVERHLEGCPRCATEVAQHHEVAGLLANSGGASPAKLWDGIASQLDGSTPPSWQSLSDRLETGPDRTGLMSSGSTNVVPLADRRGRRWVAWTAGAVAAAAAVVAVVLGVQVRHLDHQVNSLQAPLSAAERSALGLSTTKQVELVALPGSAGAASERATVVLTESGTGFVQAQGLSRLPGGETYQLWGVVGQKTISLGLLGAHPDVVVFSAAGATPVSAFAITAERSGGVVQSTNQPVVAGEVHA